MQTFFREDHRLHFPQAELSGGEFVTPDERPSRAEHVLRRLNKCSFPGVTHPGPVEMAPVRRLSYAGLQEFLETASADGKAEGYGGEVITTAMPTRHQPMDRIPRYIVAWVGHSCHASETAITRGIWAAALSSMASAEAAQRAVAGGATAACALCRLPGHHAARDQRGGYCCLNDAAVTADMIVAAGASRVAILEGDFHHGNGTQEVFYGRGDVLFASLHGGPMDMYPYDAGFADNTCFGACEGASLHHPMPPGTPFGPWAETLDHAIKQVGVNTLNVREGFETT